MTHCMTRSDWGYDGELGVDTAKLLGSPNFLISAFQYQIKWGKSQYETLNIASPFPKCLFLCMYRQHAFQHFPNRLN